eukprot:3450478-Pleurochrysis_carterae.AAC.1
MGVSAGTVTGCGECSIPAAIRSLMVKTGASLGLDCDGRTHSAAPWLFVANSSVVIPLSSPSSNDATASLNLASSVCAGSTTASAAVPCLASDAVSFLTGSLLRDGHSLFQ